MYICTHKYIYIYIHTYRYIYSPYIDTYTSLFLDISYVHLRRISSPGAFFVEVGRLDNDARLETQQPEPSADFSPFFYATRIDTCSTVKPYSSNVSCCISRWIMSFDLDGFLVDEKVHGFRVSVFLLLNRFPTWEFPNKRGPPNGPQYAMIFFIRIFLSLHVGTILGVLESGAHRRPRPTSLQVLHILGVPHRVRQPEMQVGAADYAQTP